MSEELEENVIERNGYDRPFTEVEIINTRFSDLITITGDIWAKSLNQQSDRWTGDTMLPLYNHQRALINEMIQRENALRTGWAIGNEAFFSRYAFLGDKEATGKSWTAVAYIQACKAAPSPRQGYLHQLSTTSFYSLRLEQHQRQTNLIIVQNTHMHQWSELLEQSGNLDYLIIRRNNVIQSEDLLERIRNNDCVLVPNTLYAALNRRLQNENFQWTRCFIDDWTTAHLRDVRGRRYDNHINVQSQFTWILTHNWFPFLFSDVHFENWYMQSFIENLPSSVSTDVRSFFANQQLRPAIPPMPRSPLHDFITNHNSRALLVVLCSDDFINESLAICNTKNIITPYCGDSLTRILVALFSNRLGDALLVGDTVRALEQVGATFVEPTDFVATERTNLEEPCPICFDDLHIPVVTNCCQRTFCARCLFQACQTSQTTRCPTCRGTLNGQRLQAIIHRPVPDALPHPNKVEVLVRELKARPNGRHLIYFPLEQMYGHLRNALRAADLNFDVLSGSRQVMQRKADQFSRGSTDILILLNKQHILFMKHVPAITTIIIYPDTIDTADKVRLLSRAQCIGRIEQLELIQFTAFRQEQEAL